MTFIFSPSPRMATADTVNPEIPEFSYAQASQAMHDETRRGVMQLLAARFPHVSARQWWQAYHHCRPDIWVFDGEPTPAGDGMLKLIAWITLVYGPAVGEVELNRPAYLYLSSKIRLDSVRIRRILAGHKGQLTPPAAQAYLHALQDLQQEDLIANYCRHQNYFTTYLESTSDQPSFSPAAQEGGLALEGQTGALVAAQWRALQDWLTQQHNILRPWNEEAFQVYLNWPASLVERVLFPTDVPREDPAQQPTIFTLERLAQVQVLLLTYGFALP
jgi:hypothetical protein